MDAHTSRRCWPCGTTTRCTFARVRTSARQNLKQNLHCILTTGRNGLDGLDVVVEGHAAEVSDGAELGQVANIYESKYGARFTAPEGTWFGLSDTIRAGKALVYRVTPTTILGFAKGEQFSQTRWRFA
jgi:hypothetical protein